MLKKIKSKIKSIFSEEFKFIEVIIIMVMTAFIGFVLGSFVIKKSYGLQSGASYSDDLKEFVVNYNYIVDNYYGQLNEKELLEKALESVLNEIDDPYAAYMDENDSNNFDIQLSGSYVGLGVEVGTLRENGELVVTNVFEGSPAHKVGMQIGDIITKIDEQDLETMTSLEFSKAIKEKKGQFTLTVERDDKNITFELKLDKIVLKSVEHKLLDNNIGYVAVSVFADNTYSQFKKSLEDLEKNNIKSLIIDVRNNTGGYLSSVDKILGLFLDSSRVIYQIQDKKGIKKYYSSGNENKEYKIALLTNSASASASEILAAGLKENLGAISIGKTTYGKGSAQKLHTLSDGTKYKFTSQKWLTPLGNSIDGVGVSVDYEVELDESYYKNPSFENDDQLQKAISLVSDDK